MTYYYILFLIIAYYLVPIGTLVMPNHCSAPGCKSNHRGEPYTPVFKLPTTPRELRTQWLNAFHRDNITDLSNIYVCMHHFHPKYIITVDRILQADSNFTEIIRARSKL